MPNDENPPPATGQFDTGFDTGDSGSTGAVDSTTAPAPSDTTTDDPSDTEQCDPVQVMIPQANTPVGVVFLVDNTGGMAEEAQEVSMRLNEFGNLLSSQVETGIVLISAYPDEDPQGVCVDPPLGNGMCPASDSNPPEYIHIGLPVTPLNAISHVFVTYDQWAGTFPPGARRHLVVISDGDTGVSPSDFEEDFVMLDPEQNEDYRFHVSVAADLCSEAVSIGDHFTALADQTGGYVHDLCEQNYGAFFQGLIGRILNDLGERCRWSVPSPPDGVDFDPTNIDLLLTVDDVLTLVPQVPSETECESSAIGWYWENPGSPSTMLACPETCDLLLDVAVVEATVEFGCSGDG